MERGLIGHLIFVVAVAFAIVCISYQSFARARGWPVGELLSRDASVPRIFAFVTIVWALVKSFLLFHWWSPLLIVVVGWSLAFTLTMILKKHAQTLCILGLVPGLICTILYVSERRPFGLLHRLLGH